MADKVFKLMSTFHTIIDIFIGDINRQFILQFLFKANRILTLFFFVYTFAIVIVVISVVSVLIVFITIIKIIIIILGGWRISVSCMANAWIFCCDVVFSISSVGTSGRAVAAPSFCSRVLAKTRNEVFIYFNPLLAINRKFTAIIYRRKF